MSNSPASETADAGDVYFFKYSEGGSFDIYQHGDVYGYSLAIDFSGDYSVYKRIYIDSSGTRGLEERKFLEGSFPQDTVKQLKEKLTEYSFFDYPPEVPKRGPEANLRKPSQQISISARLNPSDTLKTVKARMSGDREYYPEQFFALQSELSRMLSRLK